MKAFIVGMALFLMAGIASATPIKTFEEYNQSSFWTQVEQESNKSNTNFSWENLGSLFFITQNFSSADWYKYTSNQWSWSHQSDYSWQGGKKPPTTSVPEPTTLALFAIGLVGAGLSRRRRSKV